MTFLLILLLIFSWLVSVTFHVSQLNLGENCLDAPASHVSQSHLGTSCDIYAMSKDGHSHLNSSWCVSMMF